MGQSFREEVRLADGTVKGSYGVIDELGHKRIVHYSAGKGGFVAKEDSYKPNSQLATPHRQPKLTTQQNFNTHSRQFPVFKPANYLQARATTPLYVLPAPAQAEDVENRLPFAVGQKVDKDARPIYRFSSPLKTVNIDVPLYRTPVPVSVSTRSEAASIAKQPQIPLDPAIQYSVPSYRTSLPASVAAQDSKALVPVHVQKTPAPAIQSAEISLEEDKRFDIVPEIYKSQSRRRVTKKPRLPAKIQRVEKKMTQTEEQSYDPKIEDDYYDSAPAFIDIERLSYNIGTDKN